MLRLRHPLRMLNSRPTAQDLYSADPKFKRFGQLIEKCLSSFDNVQQWADCIAFLKNLLKVRLPHNFPPSTYAHTPIDSHCKRIRNSRTYRESRLFRSGCRNA
jgi:hypothetical protein